MKRRSKTITGAVAVTAALIIFCLVLTLPPFILTRFAESSAPEKAVKKTEEAGFEQVQPCENITVYRSEKKRTETIGFEDYIKGVVACEMPSTFRKEALKAQAVAARTYSLARVIKAEKNGNPSSHPQAPLCDTVHCQVYRSRSDLEAVKGSEWMKKDWKKICSAVDSTRDELLYYKGDLVKQALFHSSSGGRTENCEDVFTAAVPYLVSVDSPYEGSATHQKEKHTFTIDEFASKMRSACPGISFGNINASVIKIVSRSKGNRVEKMKIGGGIVEGRTVREALGLPSAKFTIRISGGKITFTSDGSGHGVGMSQYGADGMAAEGYDYKKILSHYYSGTEVW